jgi:hypothetical protein
VRIGLFVYAVLMSIKYKFIQYLTLYCRVSITLPTESVDSTVRLRLSVLEFRVLLIADQCSVFSFSLHVCNTLILTCSFR